MMPPVEKVPELPTKCPFPACRAKLNKEWVLGVTAKILGVVNVVIKCRECQRVYGLTMPVTLVDPFVKALPKDDSGVFKMLADERSGTQITDKESDEFRTALDADGGQGILKAFAVLDEYDALGYYGDDDDDEE